MNTPVIPESLVIYYFSGTGNAAAVARWFADTAELKEIPATLINMVDVKHVRMADIGPKTLVGMISPTHGFNFPPVVLHFLFRFPRGKNRVFIMNTRAGMKIGRFHLGGLSGAAQYFSALILRFKGYRIRGMRPVDLPSNWISLHPGLRGRVIRSMFLRCEKNVRRFAEKLLNGGRGYRALFDLVQDIAVTPVALAYYFVGRFVLAKSFVASSACNKCMLCINQCPVKAIRLIDQRPFWTFRCESCMKCMNECPQRAVQTAHGMVIGTMYLVMTFLIEKVYYHFVENIPAGTIKTILENGIIRFTIGSAIAVLLLLFIYRIVHFLMRFKLVERTVIFTSLTIYSWWRRYRPVRYTE